MTIQTNFEDLRDVAILACALNCEGYTNREEKVFYAGAALAAGAPFRVYPTTNISQLAENVTRAVFGGFRAFTASFAGSALFMLTHRRCSSHDFQVSMIEFPLMVGLNRLAAYFENSVCEYISSKMTKDGNNGELYQTQ